MAGLRSEGISRTFDPDRLREFVERGDKSPPPVFVGRGDILKDIETAAGHAGEPGFTRIVQGAPGAGKSALLAELAKRTDADRRKGAPVVALLSSATVNADMPMALQALAVAGGVADESWAKPGRSVSAGVSAILHANVSLSWPDGVPPQSLQELARRFPSGCWKRPVLVAVDEAQALSGDRHAPDALFLRAIHNADLGLPLTLALAGLDTTADSASKMDLTRGTVVHCIAGLAPEDTALLLDRFCAHFGLDARGCEAPLKALAQPCEGWPRHLHFAMQALGRAALETEGVLACVDWNQAGAEAAESRQRHYAAQQDDILERCRGLAAAAMQVTPGAMEGRGAERGTILGAIRDAFREDDDHGWSLPEGVTRQGLFDHMVRRGALQKRKDKTFHCPIPSFRQYLVRAGGMDPDAMSDSSQACPNAANGVHEAAAPSASFSRRSNGCG